MTDFLRKETHKVNSFLVLLITIVLVSFFITGCDLFKPQPATDFTLRDMNEEPYTLSSFAGRVIWLQFLNPETEGCKNVAERTRDRFQELIDDDFIIITVLIGNKIGDDDIPVDALICEDWVDTYTLNYPILYNNSIIGESVVDAWGMYNHEDKVPLTIIINKDFNLKFKHIGFVNWEEQIYNLIIRYKSD